MKFFNIFTGEITELANNDTLNISINVNPSDTVSVIKPADIDEFCSEHTALILNMIPNDIDKLPEEQIEKDIYLVPVFIRMHIPDNHSE